MGDRSALGELIRQGRRRQLTQLLIHEASFAAALALGGAILLLLLGTQILNWYWLVLLFAGSLAVGIYRARNRVLSPYQVAQSIDARLGLHDALSTAYFFDQQTGHYVEEQRQIAIDLARTSDVRAALPFTAPRTFLINTALLLAVGAMFAVRYGVNRGMDLRASLVPIQFDGLFGSNSKEIAQAGKKQPGDRPLDQDGHREQGPAVDPWQSKATDLDAAPDSALKTVDTPEANNPDGGADPSAKTRATGADQPPPGQDPMESGEKGEQAQQGNDASGDPNSTPDGSQSGKQEPSNKNANQQSNSGENSSLADKMRDALANLMAKLKMSPKPSDGKPGGTSRQQSSQAAQKQSQGQDPNAKASPSQQQAESSANAQAQGDQQSQSAAQQAAQGKSDAKNSDRSSEDGKSGIGKQDGDKAAREAEQLAAMGKISELIGKRAANVQGEVMVEVASGKQQLKTQYSDRSATHVEAGGEINRDEVPLAYQQYVQQYFEEVRKLPAAKKAVVDKSKGSGN